MDEPTRLRSEILSEAGRSGAILRDLGSTLEERRARTAPARAARAARRAERGTKARTGKLAARIAAAEAALAGMSPAERAAQVELIATLKASHDRIAELRERLRDTDLAELRGEAS